MIIISRQTAIRERRIRYFTGEPCKHGHVAERYTKTAGCVECLHPKFDNGIPRYRSAKRRMVKKRFRIWPEDRSTFAASIYAFALSHEALMKPHDVEVAGFRVLGCSEGYDIHSFWIFPEDESAARLLEVPLTAKRRALAPAAPTVTAVNQTEYWPEGDPL